MKKKQSPGHFNCCFCGGHFQKAWSDAEARAECESLYGKRQASDARSCDGCWKAGLDTGAPTARQVAAARTAFVCRVRWQAWADSGRSR